MEQAKNNEVAVAQQNTLPEAPTRGGNDNQYADYNKAAKIAKLYAGSDIVPASYSKNVNNCFVAANMALRMDVDPLMVMQQLYVVKGKPSWSGQACMAFIRNLYKDVQVVYTGTRGTDSRGCYVQAKNGEVTLQGTEITIGMAKAEGWISNPKWRNMPEQMLAYRAAAFFARVNCPEILMGCRVEGEAEDEKPEARIVEDVL